MVTILFDETKCQEYVCHTKEAQEILAKWALSTQCVLLSTIQITEYLTFLVSTFSMSPEQMHLSKAFLNFVECGTLAKATVCILLWDEEV